MKIATIAVEGGRAQLHWARGRIWTLLPNGRLERGETCSRQDAAQIIETAYRDPNGVAGWDLVWENNAKGERG